MMCSRLLPVVVMLTSPLGAFAEDRPELSVATQEVLRLLSSYRVRVPNDAATEVKLIPRPLLTYGDAARSNESGTLWAWTNAAGRPLAFIENYRPEGNNAAWVHALTLSSPSLIELDVATNPSWKPKNSHYEMRRCADDIAAVADSAPQRLRQMKEISRRFQAHEFWDPNNSRFELRLLVQPVLRYSDAAVQIVDGAVFVFAHGTNPEVLLLIEARPDKNTTVWNYGCVRLGSAEMHMAYEDREVWTVPRTPGVVGTPADPYWLAVLQNPPKPAD